MAVEPLLFEEELLEEELLDPDVEEPAESFRTCPGWMIEDRLSPLARSRVLRLTLWRAAMWDRVSPRLTV